MGLYVPLAMPQSAVTVKTREQCQSAYCHDSQKYSDQQLYTTASLLAFNSSFESSEPPFHPHFTTFAFNSPAFAFAWSTIPCALSFASSTNSFPSAPILLASAFALSCSAASLPPKLRKCQLVSVSSPLKNDPEHMARLQISVSFQLFPSSQHNRVPTKVVLSTL